MVQSWWGVCNTETIVSRYRTMAHTTFRGASHPTPHILLNVMGCLLCSAFTSRLGGRFNVSKKGSLRRLFSPSLCWLWWSTRNASAAYMAILGHIGQTLVSLSLLRQIHSRNQKKKKEAFYNLRDFAACYRRSCSTQSPPSSNCRTKHLLLLLAQYKCYCTQSYIKCFTLAISSCYIDTWKQSFRRHSYNNIKYSLPYKAPDHYITGMISMLIEQKWVSIEAKTNPFLLCHHQFRKH